MNEYNDIKLINDIYKKYNQSELKTETKTKTDTETDIIGLTLEINKKLAKNTGRSMELDTFKLLKDQIRNYRSLTQFQLLSLEHLSEKQKIDIILLYNEMFLSLEELLQ